MVRTPRTSAANIAHGVDGQVTFRTGAAGGISFSDGRRTPTPPYSAMGLTSVDLLMVLALTSGLTVSLTSRLTSSLTQALAKMRTMLVFNATLTCVIYTVLRDPDPWTVAFVLAFSVVPSCILAYGMHRVREGGGIGGGRRDGTVHERAAVGFLGGV